MALIMDEDAKTNHARNDDPGAVATVRSGTRIGAVLATMALLGGGLAGLATWSHHPSPTQRDVAAAPVIAGPEAVDGEAASEIATKPPHEFALAERGEASAPAQEAAIEVAAPIPSAPAEPSPPPMPAAAPLASRLVPLPVPRPPEFRTSRAPVPRVTARRAVPVAAAPVEDTRSFVEKLFGIENTEPPRLAYAALETKPVDDVFRRALSVVPRVGTGGVAVYDIRARVVTLPNGEKLEAHSGLGASMDDPGHVHVRMKGPTPVGTYDISEREQPFHGVRALRLNPVGGPEAVHGRVGLLAHTYMLGASGASNGCVSFRDYDKFLQAYLRGEVQRLVVVAGG
jgi:hypothetical protein